ncbi:hypothetical protein Desku_2473 [Desulfofundulus kuznetsovii DSM 6115]|uniref:Uncharacterized protein n=1 Tax=Desulfofundulus kuznetsovii (strain DSM 6115 / VKM B-1805 / 17) TaxID=760568 RepID=A0AAU8Q4G3_DESK7|nr:hypothetical protein Desku_2473 [Desulfofundulus kuznetsovii DSM 6115]
MKVSNFDMGSSCHFSDNGRKESFCTDVTRLSAYTYCQKDLRIDVHEGSQQNKEVKRVKESKNS